MANGQDHDQSPGPDHRQGGTAREQADAAARSLSDALQVSFAMLKVAMVILLVIYLGSGVFRVEEQQRAVRLVFGKIVQNPDNSNRIYGPGLYIGLPFPIGEVVIVPVTSQTLSLDRAFMFELQEGDQGLSIEEIAERYANRALNPERDNSLMTGDANLVMGMFTVTWKVNDPALFIENVGLAQPDEGPDDNLAADPLYRAQEMVRSATERSILHAVAEVNAESFISGGGGTNTEKAALAAQAMLDDLRAGIEIERIQALMHIPPPSAYSAFQAVINAESERATKINQARQEAARTLGETAGKATNALIGLIEQYETAVDSGDEEAAVAIKAQIDDALMRKFVPFGEGDMEIGGSVAERINQAEAFRDRARERVKAEAQAFMELYVTVYGDPDLPPDQRPTAEESRKALTILTSRLWQDMRERVLTSPTVETIYAPTDTLRVDINADPKIKRLREELALEAARAAAEQEQQP